LPDIRKTSHRAIQKSK